MANELAVAYLPSKNIYAVIWRRSNNYVWDAGDAALEAAGTWDDDRVGECDVALTERGAGYYSVDFPSSLTTAAIYDVLYFNRESTFPAITDQLIGRSTIIWDGGAAVTTPSTGSGQSLSTLQTMCEYYGWNDTTSAGLTRLTGFINHTISMLASLAPWPEYIKLDGEEEIPANDDTETLTETNIARLGTVIRSDKSQPLDYWSPGEYLHASKYHAGTGPPNYYTLRRYTASGLIKVDIYVYPKPTSATTLYYTYQISPSWLSVATDETDWPNDRLWLLEQALRIRLAARDRDAGATMLYGDDFMAKVNRAFNASRPTYMPIVQKPMDWIRPGKWTLSDMEKTITS